MQVCTKILHLQLTANDKIVGYRWKAVYIQKFISYNRQQCEWAKPIIEWYIACSILLFELTT